MRVEPERGTGSGDLEMETQRPVISAPLFSGLTAQSMGYTMILVVKVPRYYRMNMSMRISKCEKRETLERNAPGWDCWLRCPDLEGQVS